MLVDRIFHYSSMIQSIISYLIPYPSSFIEFRYSIEAFILLSFFFTKKGSQLHLLEQLPLSLCTYPPFSLSEPLFVLGKEKNDLFPIESSFSLFTGSVVPIASRLMVRSEFSNGALNEIFS